MNAPITIVGAGLTGLMCAIHLAQKGILVRLLERRLHQEILHTKSEERTKSGRSMSMDISARGIHALKQAHVFDSIAAQSVPMLAKITHHEDGRQLSIPYGQNQDEHILTVSRNLLYETLLNRCRSLPNIEIQFGTRLLDFDPDNSALKIIGPDAEIQTIFCSILIGADGINSTVREIMERNFSFDFKTYFFPMSYKELTIAREHANTINLNAMHIWPRKNAMLVAQPNSDHSFTCALLMHESGAHPSFETINSEQHIRAFFSSSFNDVSTLMPDLETEYLRNPVGKLKIIQCSKWSYGNFALLLGDAAHGMVPFFGQGVNCCFEDCTFLAQCLDETDHWPDIFLKFDSQRVEEANAINTMSYENYPELFLGSDLARIQLLKEIEAMLANNFRNSYRTYHNLVCFERVPYTFAQKVKALQISLLEKLSLNAETLTDIDHDVAQREVLHYQKSLRDLKMDGNQ